RELYCCTSPLRHGCAACWSTRIWLPLRRQRHRCVACGDMAGLEQSEANDPPRAARHADLWHVGGGFCSLSPLSSIASADCGRRHSGDSFWRAGYYDAPDDCPGPPPWARCQRVHPLLHGQYPAWLSAIWLALGSLGSFHRPAHLRCSLFAGYECGVDMAEGGGGIPKNTVNIHKSRRDLIDPPVSTNRESLWRRNSSRPVHRLSPPTSCQPLQGKRKALPLQSLSIIAGTVAGQAQGIAPTHPV